MTSPLVQCPKCRSWWLDGVFNRTELSPCPGCGVRVRVEIFPALFRRQGPASSGEAVLVEGESSCFYHPQKKAALPCDACGRFLCSLCDCEVKGRHLCPACLQSGQKKQSIKGLEDVRILYGRQAMVLAVLPLFVTGAAAVFMAIRYRNAPLSLVSPGRWMMPTALILGSLQTLAFLLLIGLAIFK